MTNYNKTYWRVDAEYQTIKFVEDVSDKAPVGIWIQTLGLPYAYFENEKDAKEVFHKLIDSEVTRLQDLKKSPSITGPDQ